MRVLVWIFEILFGCLCWVLLFSVGLVVLVLELIILFFILFFVVGGVGFCFFDELLFLSLLREFRVVVVFVMVFFYFLSFRW